MKVEGDLLFFSFLSSLPDFFFSCHTYGFDVSISAFVHLSMRFLVLFRFSSCFFSSEKKPFKRDFKNIVKTLGKSAQFTPFYVVYNGASYGCTGVRGVVGSWPPAANYPATLSTRMDINSW